MENLIKRYIEKFNKEPYMIGLYWDDKNRLLENISKSIEDNKPYNEYNLLSDEDKKSYDDNVLVF